MDIDSIDINNAGITTTDIINNADIGNAGIMAANIGSNDVLNVANRDMLDATHSDLLRSDALQDLGRQPSHLSLVHANPQGNGQIKHSPADLLNPKVHEHLDHGHLNHQTVERQPPSGHHHPDGGHHHSAGGHLDHSTGNLEHLENVNPHLDHQSGDGHHLDRHLDHQSGDGNHLDRHLDHQSGDGHHLDRHLDHQSGENHHLDHVDGHTLSTVPLTVGCPDPSLLSNIFQDTVAEGFIDFSESGGQQSFLTTVSSVLFPVSSPQFSGANASPSFTGVSCTSSYPLLRTPVYSSSTDNQVYSTTHQESLEFTATAQFTGQTHVYPDNFVPGLDVQELACINLQPMKSTDLDIPLIVNSLEEARLSVLSNTWTPELKMYLENKTLGDLTIRAPSLQGFQSISCHKLMMAVVSPLLSEWLSDIEGVDDDACIIFPDFSIREVEDFLKVVYLQINENTDSFNNILRGINGCVGSKGVEKSLKSEERQIFEDRNLEGEDRSVFKGEERSRRSKVEVKDEEQELEKAKKGLLKENLDDEDKILESETVNPVCIVPMEIGDDPAKTKKTKGPFKCDKCGKLFKERRILKEHENLHGDPKFECTEGCGKKFHTKSNMKAHIDVVHLKKKDLPCEICGKLFYNASLLKSHKKSHSDLKLSCTHCPATFSAAKSLKNHIRTKHTTEENIPKCYICQKTLASELVLRSHIARVHFNEKNFVCVQCGKAFYEKSELKVHLDTHGPSQNLNCQLCLVVFKNRKNLLAHVKNKHGDSERKHVCHLCGKSFYLAYHLNRHMEGHQQKSVFCKLCSKGFVSESKLQEHTRKIHEKWRKLKKPEMNAVSSALGELPDIDDPTRNCGKLSSSETSAVLLLDGIMKPDKGMKLYTDIPPLISSNDKFL